MSRSFDRNIERLKANQRSVSQQEQTIRTNTAISRGQYEIAHAKDIANKLAPFSSALQDWKDKDIARQKEEGREEHDRDQLARAQWLEEHGTAAQQKLVKLEEAQAAGELAYEIIDTEKQEREIQLLKEKLLNAQGTAGYPDAERLAQLSPWQQVGFVQQRIKGAKDAFEDQLAHSMQNGTTDVTLGNITYNASEISGEKLAFSMKKHALNIYADKVYRNLGFHKYSKEMLAMAKVPDTVSKAKTSLLTKYRTEYNIESSILTRAKNRADWNSSPKGGVDMERFLLVEGNTINTKGAIVSHRGALDALMAQIVGEGVDKGGSTEDWERYRDTPIPEDMRKRIGAKPGATFGSHWPQRFNKARVDILEGNRKSIEAERKILKADVIELENNLIKLQREDPSKVTTQMVDEFKRKATALGYRSEFLENFMTTQEREIDIQKDTIQDRINAQNGFISHAQLNEYHPDAATKYREQATKLEKAHKNKHNVDGKIKAALNRTWTEAGMTSKEKPVVWEYALVRATEDYDRKFNQLVAMGYDVDSATKLALDGPPGSVKDGQGNPKADFQGVVNEILANGAASKYTEEGEAALNEVADAHIRVDAINKGKVEMQLDPFLIEKGVIGGQYGKDRLNEIVENIEKYGTWKGLGRSDHAMNYYDGLARGKRQLSAHGIIDLQLKAMGHPGLYPARVVQVPDPDGNIEAANDALQPTKYEGSADTYNTVTEDMLDLINHYSGNSSRWDHPDNIPSYYGGNY